MYETLISFFLLVTVGRKGEFLNLNIKTKWILAVQQLKLPKKTRRNLFLTSHFENDFLKIILQADSWIKIVFDLLYGQG